MFGRSDSVLRGSEPGDWRSCSMGETDDQAPSETFVLSLGPKAVSKCLTRERSDSILEWCVIF